MANQKDPYGQFTTNKIGQVVKAFGDVPAVLGTLVALGVTYCYTHLLITNSLDNDIVIAFGDNEITFYAGKDVAIDNFKFDGTVQYKYSGSAPTSGALQVIYY